MDEVSLVNFLSNELDEFMLLCDDEDDDHETKPETSDVILSRHRKEISQLEKKEFEMKKAATRGSKAKQKAKKKQVEKTSFLIKKGVSKDEDEDVEKNQIY
ncbi:uncharacterized protein HKW66_Vig0210400 [Vigna angularis]|uniref:Uncharacterized protein n=1 Tax=Phaseolus angularis TaxID=3914 RepID=A0A8T0JFX4_PHAAN|nr:uncharacterized protein HKW66_Vig0210400 [Vigna angularis]